MTPLNYCLPLFIVGALNIAARAKPRDDGRWDLALRIIECGNGDYRGKTSLGLAELGDGRLVMALAEPGKGVRPASLDPGTKEAKVLHLERR